MTLEELYKIAEQFPMANVQEDIDGEVVIYTGLMYEAPLGYVGSGPQNIPPLNRCDVDLRPMNAKDLPDAKI
tara:strand:- start:339 stop:554 length:216 start_codon:yes stop_codon:yes gene_type:complete